MSLASLPCSAPRRSAGSRSAAARSILGPLISFLPRRLPALLSTPEAGENSVSITTGIPSGGYTTMPGFSVASSNIPVLSTLMPFPHSGYLARSKSPSYWFTADSVLSPAIFLPSCSSPLHWTQSAHRPQDPCLPESDTHRDGFVSVSLRRLVIPQTPAQAIIENVLHLVRYSRWRHLGFHQALGTRAKFRLSRILRLVTSVHFFLLVAAAVCITPRG